MLSHGFMRHTISTNDDMEVNTMRTHHLDLLWGELVFCLALLPQVGGGVLDLRHALLCSTETRGRENSWIILRP